MANPLTYLAGPKGLEPSPSGVTGRRYNQLNYDPVFFPQQPRAHLEIMATLPMIPLGTHRLGFALFSIW